MARPDLAVDLFGLWFKVCYTSGVCRFGCYGFRCYRFYLR
ncbi:hypothetical protein SHLO109777_08870 [Shewanella loihica]